MLRRSSIFYSSRSAGTMIGMGVVASVDEIIFHQLLGWHHFYDAATPTIGLISDGLLHAATLLMIVAGFFLLLDLYKRGLLQRTKAWAGYFIGMGSFQIFDGIVNHKVFCIHQIRYGVDLVAYDLTWLMVGFTLLGVGLVILKRPHHA